MFRGRWSLPPRALLIARCGYRASVHVRMADEPVEALDLEGFRRLLGLDTQPKAQRKVLSRANVNMRDIKGRTALTRAAAKGHLEIVKVLLQTGVDENDQASALMWAASLGQIEVTKELLKATVRVGIRNPQG